MGMFPREHIFMHVLQLKLRYDRKNTRMTEYTPRHSDRPTARIEHLLAGWRARTLRPILWVVALLASANTSISVPQFLERDQNVPAAVSVVLLIATWSAALLPLRSEGFRIWLTLGVLYGAAVLSLITMGLGAGGVMAVFGFVALSALLLGTHAAGYALALAAFTMALAALGFHSGVLQVADPAILDARELWNWLRVSTFGVCVLAAVGGVSLSLLNTLTKTLEERGELVTKLRREVEERERANAALAEAQQRLIHGHKLEAVGRLAGGIAHDFNNTLTVILSYSELLKKRMADDPTGSDLADQIVRAAEQGGDLTKQLLTFSRRQVVKPRTVDVQHIAKSTERALGRLVSSSIRVHRPEQPEELCVRIDPTQLEQALLNLSLNARDAMPDGGDLYLETQAMTVTPADGIPVLPGPYVVVRVRDTGTGMSEDTLSHIFEPFFTTKEPGLGTGLGLPNVREAAEAAGGYVSVKSELGRGTEFSLFFPRADGRVSGVEQRQKTQHPKPPSILVVEDELQIREVIRAILSDAGYEVHLATTAKHALQLAATRSYDLLWADLVMPDLPGSKLIDEFLRLHPSTPVLVCSAYGTDEKISKQVARGELTFLAKPFTRKALVDAVDRALLNSDEGGSGRGLSSPRAAG